MTTVLEIVPLVRHVRVSTSLVRAHVLATIAVWTMHCNTNFCQHTIWRSRVRAMRTGLAPESAPRGRHVLKNEIQPKPTSDMLWFQVQFLFITVMLRFAKKNNFFKRLLFRISS